MEIGNVQAELGLLQRIKSAHAISLQFPCGRLPKPAVSGSAAPQPATEVVTGNPLGDIGPVIFCETIKI